MELLVALASFRCHSALWLCACSVRWGATKWSVDPSFHVKSDCVEQILWQLPGALTFKIAFGVGVYAALLAVKSGVCVALIAYASARAEREVTAPPEQELKAD